MKEVKSMLVLNKRTVACLNNLEMQHVRGGDGEVGLTSIGICTETDPDPGDSTNTINPIPTKETGIKSQLTVLATKLGLC
jgi:hypothetical protein